MNALAIQFSQNSNLIPGHYIVVLGEGESPERVASHHGLVPRHVYRHAFRGFAAAGVTPAKLKELKGDHRVEFVEQDKFFHIFQTTPTGVDRIEADENGFAKIDGVDERVDVDIAILDTGIDQDHPDLNVIKFVNFAGGGNDDRHGHGTHVAGTAAALDNGVGVVGVAPGARLWAIKVLGNSGSGYLSDIIAGIDYVTANSDEIEVSNMSLGGMGWSDALRLAILRSVNAGVVYVVAAGNNGMDVFGFDGLFNTFDDIIPAAYPEVATISAMVDTNGRPGGGGGSTGYGPDDSFASFSNYARSKTTSNPVNSPGAAIDLLLPGVSIYSTYKDGSYATGSGTSMASPHAAGLAALYIAEHGRATNAAGVYDIRQALIDGGVTQESPEGLDILNDPDGNTENIGMAASTGSTESVSISPSSQIGEGFPGEVIYTFTITNNGDKLNTYSLSTTSSWTSFVTPEKITLDPDATGSVDVVHTVPDGASPGDSDLGTLTAISTNPGASDEATFTTTARGYTVDISPSSLSGSGGPGETLYYVYTVTNTGTELDTYTVSESSTWTSSVSPETLILDPGASAVVTVSHDIPGAAEGGGSDTGTVTVSSLESSDSATFTTTVMVLGGTMHVGDLDGKKILKGKSGRWEVFVTVTIHNQNCEPVANAVVEGMWIGGATGLVVGTTGIEGTVRFKTGKMNGGDTVTFTVLLVVHDPLIYNILENHDPDGDSDGTIIIVKK